MSDSNCAMHDPLGSTCRKDEELDSISEMSDSKCEVHQKLKLNCEAENARFSSQCEVWTESWRDTSIRKIVGKNELDLNSNNAINTAKCDADTQFKPTTKVIYSSDNVVLVTKL